MEDIYIVLLIAAGIISFCGLLLLFDILRNIIDEWIHYNWVDSVDRCLLYPLNFVGRTTWIRSMSGSNIAAEIIFGEDGKITGKTFNKHLQKDDLKLVGRYNKTTGRIILIETYKEDYNKWYPKVVGRNKCKIIRFNEKNISLCIRREDDKYGNVWKLNNCDENIDGVTGLQLEGVSIV